ncbi:MAG: TonB-dependent receptor [Paludibacteraceae bacterium]|nr:TonB-dependent receptor [Paludibacteraceae bacterium]OPZ02606.1 MAG: Vitamin B12 transporter BtuB [Bacteroidetes bacterium ADurb.BinA395]HOF97875.1 TonB-dependent receptor [Paludibacteraceae bacterium]HOR38450.1 TonB-dependent receptor [Paludibacteraceae bacterium]HPL75799.1 TonB-dependent receptor [Paludibacteraceae bacterium]
MKRTKKPKFLKREVLVLIALFISTISAFSQIKVTGTVLDTKREPLIGVNITVKGSRTGTISDFNGKFNIDVPDRQSVLVFSYIGYKTIERTIPASGQLTVILEEETQTIDEVVVVAYGTQKKSHLTGAVSSLKNEKMDEIPVSRVDQALQGKIAGVQINNVNPEAGAAPKIRVRGLGSISASSDPLIVIDGFPVPDGLSMVSMADVQSVEVLKDASSAALYGSRAAGGVILITTKSGEINKPKYNFKMYSGFRNPLKLPDMLSTEEYVALLYREADMRKLDPAVNGIATETMAFNKITEPEKAGYLIMKYLDDQPTDWLNEGLRDRGTMQNYQLSASGGDKNLKYFVSGNYVNEDGIMLNSTYDKFTFRAKLDAKLSKAATLGVNLSPTYSRQERPAVDLTDYMRFPSWLPIRHNEATAALTGKVAGDYAQPSDFNGINISGIGYNNEVWSLPGVTVWNSSNQNPVSIRERTSIFTDDYRFQGNIYLTLNLLPGLQFKTSNGAYLLFREYNKKEQTSANKAGNPNSLTRQLTTHRELLSENTLNYNKKISNHEFDALLGFTMQQTNDNYNRIVGTNFPDEQILSFNLASQILLDSPSIDGTTSFYYTESLVSLLGRLNYAYLGKYMMSASFRADGSSKFYKGNKWGTFPAFSAGWRASEEKFMKNFEWLSNLKLRVSYGLTGNNNIPQYAYMNSINTSNYVLGSGNGTLVQGMVSNSSSLGNPDITWEQTSEANYGIDFGFLNSRLNFSIEYYNSNTIQLLLQQPAMYITGHQSYWNNIGKVNNKGIEIELNTTNIANKKFTWKTSANFSTNKNKLLNYGDKEYEDNFGERSEVYRAIVGEPAIQYYGYKTDGVYTTFEEVAAAKALKDKNGNPFTYTKFAPIVGGIKVVNINGDNKIDTEDRTVLGDPFPDFTWGITNTFTYKNFDLSFLIQGVQGIDIINGNVNYNEQLRYNKAYTNNRYVSPMFPGDGKTVYSNTTSGSDLMLTDYCIEDGSYGAIRDFTLGYTLPQNLLKSLKLRNLRVYFSAENLVYIMAPSYRGINPEARRTASNYTSPLVDGYQRGAFPLNRTFTAGLDINF